MFSEYSNENSFNNIPQYLNNNKKIKQKNNAFFKDEKSVKKQINQLFQPNNINNINSESSTYNSDFNDLEERLKKLQLTLKEKDEKIEELEKKVLDKKKLKEELSSKDLEINKIKNKNTYLNDEIIAYKKQIDNMNLIISSNEETLEKLKKLNLVSKIDLKKGGSLIEELMPKYDEADHLEFYDIIVDINSIKGFVIGWDVLKNNKGAKYFDSTEDYSVKIGVVGNGNKGKSYILSKISDIELPVGESIKTKGLSIKFPELKNYSNRTITLLDSAGQETPVLNNNKSKLFINKVDNNENNEISKEEKLAEKSRDKLLTEFFLQNYIVKYSDLLIIVVGILTFSEQKLINKIKRTFLNLGKKGQLIIIHNLQSYVTLGQVKTYINETLLKSETFNLKENFKISKESTLNNKNNTELKWSYYHEPKSEPNTIHLIFAREGSQAGNFYNKNGVQHIYDIMNTINEKEPLNLCENIKSLFTDLSSQILETQISNINIEYDKDKIQLKLDSDKNEIKLKKCSIDELGLNTFRSSGFEPNYCYYIHKKMLTIILEVCGNFEKFKVNADCENGKCIIKIEGNKINDIEQIKKECSKLKSKREFGPFSFTIVIEDTNIDTNSGKLEKKDGLIKICYPIKNSSSTLSFD